MNGSRAVLTKDSVTVAPRLLGAVLTSQVGGEPVSVRITEVEAYRGEHDPASHAYRGLTPRTQVMFGPAGHLYCYFTYGMHWCANVVCEVEGVAAAVLLRAGEVVDGVELARARRTIRRSGRGSDRELARGPARLAQCLGLDGATNGVDLLDPGSLVTLTGVRSRRPRAVGSGPRVGITRAVAEPWRFWLVGDPTVSTFRPGTPRRRTARPATTDASVHQR